MSIVIHRRGINKITRIYTSKEATRELNWCTRKYLFNTKEDRNEKIEEQKLNKTYTKKITKWKT